jgi:hypothetical protein
MAHVYLLTESRFIDTAASNSHTQNVLKEDELLSAALLNFGISSQRVNWSDESIDWSKADAAVFRTTWDYFSRFKEFDPWLNMVSKEIQLINPLPLLRWNMDKHYLLDLNDRGFPIVPSVFIEKGETRSLAELHAASGWDAVILKPCISGTARHTYRLDQTSIPKHESILAELLEEESMMLQEFHESIIERGEVSHMIINGKYTHSVLKQSKGDDFRVQDSFGGTLHEYSASSSEIALAEAVFASCTPSPVYGRLDIMWNSKGDLMIGELEIIEPDLWMRMSPASAVRFAEGIANAL